MCLRRSSDKQFESPVGDRRPTQKNSFNLALAAGAPVTRNSYQIYTLCFFSCGITYDPCVICELVREQYITRLFPQFCVRARKTQKKSGAERSEINKRMFVYIMTVRSAKICTTTCVWYYIYCGSAARWFLSFCTYVR